MKKLRAFFMIVVMMITIMVPIDLQPVDAASGMSVAYAVHIQTYGDSQGFVRNGKTAGTTGQAKRLEAIKIKLEGTEYSGDVVYKTHVQSYGWENWKSNGMEAGTRGQAKRLEAIQIYLKGEIAKHYDITYRVHCQSYGWMAWVKNGAIAGTTGQSKRLEAIEIKLVKKAKISPMGIVYRTHCQTYGWLPWVCNGAESGTTGQAKRLEAIQIVLSGNQYSGGVQYRTHIQSYGWEKNNAIDGGLSGTSGQAKRLEAIEISLYGEVANYYDIYYRVHAQTYGWLGWAKNGEKSGTSALSKRLEAIEIKLVKKGGAKPTDNSGRVPYIDGNAQSSNNKTQAERVVALCNIERSKNGITNNLIMDPVLMQAAEIRAKELQSLFSHTRPDGRSCSTVLDQLNYSWMSCGENIAAGYANADEVMYGAGNEKGWMGSTGHRSNILSKKFNKIGVACVNIPGSRYGTYWVQVFSN